MPSYPDRITDKNSSTIAALLFLNIGKGFDLPQSGIRLCRCEFIHNYCASISYFSRRYCASISYFSRRSLLWASASASSFSASSGKVRVSDE